MRSAKIIGQQEGEVNARKLRGEFSLARFK